MESWKVPDDIKSSSKPGVQMIQHPLSYKVQIFDQLQSEEKVHLILFIIKLNIEGFKLEFRRSDTIFFLDYISIVTSEQQHFVFMFRNSHILDYGVDQNSDQLFLSL